MQKMIRKYDQLGAIGLFLAALSGHWLITPANQPTATPLQYGWGLGTSAGWARGRPVDPSSSAYPEVPH